MITAILLTLLFAPPQEGAPARDPGTLDRVTIYSGQALVERVFTAGATDTGPLELLLGPFPTAAVTDSFQARIDAGPARFLDLEVRAAVGEPADSAERERLRQELEQLRGERRKLDADLAAIEGGSGVVKSVIQAIGATPPAGGASGVGQEITIQNLFQFVMERSRELAAQRSAYETAVRRVDAQIAELERKLREAERGGLRRFQEVKVSLFFERPGEARLRLSYLAEGASWRPTYDVRVAPDLTGVTVGLVAQVQQQSGEDWNDAQILLSTSVPSIGLDPPPLPLRVYDLPRPATAPGESSQRLGYASEDAVAPARRARAGLAVDKEEAGYEPAPEVQVQDFGITAQFTLPLRKSVRATGEPHRFILREVPLQVRAERYVVPSRSDKAFLRAQVTLSGDAPLLAGPAKVFLGPDYLGQATFPTLRPGDSTTIHLGIDPNLSVTYETVVDERDDPGFLASTVRLTKVYRATLKLSASAPGPIEVLLEDSIPVSRVDSIQIKPTQLQPAPLEDEESKQRRQERGVLRWRLSIAPGQSHNVRWGYVASFDESLTPILSEE